MGSPIPGRNAGSYACGQGTDARTTLDTGIRKTGETPGNGKRNPKAGGRADERDAPWRYALITRLSSRWPITVCQVLQVSHSAYYAWRQRPIDTERMQLRIRVRELYNRSPLK
ncbi:hypothetical protein [Xenorhabdus miraniensis]|uniref:hypothetical protein n=1 Tax=Xenorhabdus miraniensis TaxID=351674 RepID=UPI00142DA0B4|nr:hypothetical protein [Xenorhabdus miraniensis]